MTEARKPGLRGEHEISRNTIAQGRPDCFWRTCGDLSSCPFSFGREAAGAQSIRLSLRPLFFRGANGLWITRAHCAARTWRLVFRHGEGESDEAIQSSGHSGMVRKHQTRNLEIPGSPLRGAPE